MIKIFTTNKNNKIELTKEELKELLDEAYWDGYKANSNSWTYTSPHNWSPYITTSSATIKTNTGDFTTNAYSTISLNSTPMPENTVLGTDSHND